MRLLGAGGMGAVYEAEHVRMQRRVALKTISPELVRNADAVERFNREIQAAAKLSHPNVVAAYDADQAGDVHFLVMELAEGETLARHVAEHGPLPVARACEIIRQAALGLQHAHERGMVHRDIKPHNLMLVRDATARAGDQTKILDFGLARFVQESTRESRTELGAVMGTPDYMAPEQALNTRQADIRADIYSLGCTLYFLLTAQPPFAGVTAMETLLRHQSVEPRRLGEVRPDAPAALEPVLARMLAKRPEQRYQTPAEVALALKPFAELKGAVAEPVAPSPLARSPLAPSPVDRPPEDRRRRWLAAAWLGGAAALLCGVIIVIQSRQGTTTMNLPDDQPKVLVNGQQVYPPPDKAGAKAGAKKGDKADDKDRRPAVAQGGAVEPGTGKGVWQLQQSGVTTRLRDVAFVNETTGVAVGDDTTIVRTTDGGKTWRRVNAAAAGGKRVDFGRVLFSGNEGWAISSILRTIWHSADAGASWKAVPLPEPNQSGNGIAHHSAVGATYYLHCVGYLWKTSDGGTTWQEVTRQFPGASLDGADLFFLDASHGWYARVAGTPGQFSVARTADGGKTWTTTPLPDRKDAWGNFAHVWFHSPKQGWVVPHVGTVHASSDGGATWQPHPLGHDRTNSLLRVHFLDAKVGHVLCAAYPGEVRRTTDGGKTWQTLGKLHNADHLDAMSFPSARHGWVVGEGGYIEHYHEAAADQ